MPGRVSVRNVAFEYGTEVNSKFRLLSVESVPVEEQRLLRVSFRIVPAVISRVQPGRVGILRLRQEIIKNLMAAIEAVLVFSPAVEVDLETLEFRCVLCEFQRVVRIPVRKVELPACREANPIDVVEERLELIESPARDGRGVEMGNYRRAVDADGPEHLGMLHCNLEGAIAAHGDSAQA